MAEQQTSWVNPDMRFEVSGWVVDPSRLGVAVSIELWVGERRVAALAARAIRRQVRKLFGGDGRHGFRVVLPFEYYNGRAYEVRLIRTDTEQAFFTGTVCFADLRQPLAGGAVALGAVTEADAGGLVGWVVDPERPTVALSVELWLDGERLVTVAADLASRGLPLRGDEQRHGFALRLPSSAYDDAAHQVEVRLTGGGVLAGVTDQLTLPAKRRPSFQGDLSLTGEGRIAGQLVANGQQDLPLLLQIEAGDAALGSVWVENGEPIEFEAAALAVSQPLRGALAAVIMPEGLRVPIEGEAIATLVSARLAEARLAISARPAQGLAGGGLDLVVLDGGGRQIAELALRPDATGELYDGAIELPQPLPAALSLAFAGDLRALGETFDVLAAPGAAERRGRGATNGVSVWQDRAAPAVQLALAARGGSGLAARDGADGFAGSFSFDAQLGELTGWVIDLSDPLRRVVVELLADERAIARATAADPVLIGSARGRVSVSAGFTFQLAELLPSTRAQLTVRVADGAHLPGDPIAYAPGLRVNGAVTTLGWADFRLDVSGHVADLMRPGQPVPVELLVDGRSVDRTLARTPRDGQPGFSFALSARTGSAALAERVEVRAHGATLPLPAPALGDTDAIAAAHSATPPPEPPASAAEAVIGSFDTLEPGRAAGWALVADRPSAPVDIVLYTDGVPFAHARTRFGRGDVARKHGGDGFAGFAVELPPNLGLIEPVRFRAEPMLAEMTLDEAVRPVPARLEAVTPASLPGALRAAPPTVISDRPTISTIILNQNGETLLDALFASVLAHEPDPRIEWLVVDHVSIDGSEAACARARGAGLNVRWLPREANHSFSDSNNWGARHAAGEVLLFVNNDVELVGRTIGAMAELLADPTVGMVGLKLLDAIEHGIWAAAPPIQHLGVFFAPMFAERRYRPFEGRLVPELAPVANTLAEVPAVTGAFMAMRRADFDAIGGFDPRYFYGWEDVDLCLRVTMGLDKRIVCLNERGAVHHRGFTRSDGRHKDPRRAANAEAFNRLWGRRLRRAIRRDLLSRPGHWLGHRPVIAFAVTEASDETAAGDYFTALELGRALVKRLPVHVAYLGAGSWYDLSDVDVLIAMVDRFDPAKIEAARPHLQLVAWARNWFDRWCDKPGIHAFDQVWASSDKAAAYMAERIGRPVATVRIATNPDRFRAAPDPALASDYCFTGSRFGVARDIELDLRPEQLAADGAVFGHGWSESALATIDRGPVPYSRIAQVYASTTLVLDDANVATKGWGSCNSRVFDALGAGRLVLTNGEDGARELFGDLLPTWSNRRSLTQAIEHWLAQPDERSARVAALQTRVLAEHSYDQRAIQVADLLGAGHGRLKFAIKIAATEAASAAWGDYHFAQSLAEALRAEGHLARVDLRERWYGGLADTDDVVIVLRGLIAYEPAAHQINLCWIISHPDEVSGRELGGYDHVYVASALFAATLAPQTDVPVSTMLQCTDAGRFSPDLVDAHVPAADLLFVGNSRGVEREGVRWSLDEGLDLTLYGGGWTTLVPKTALAGRYVPNEILGSLYARARWVLCDHWGDMRRHGFVSNRAFDVLAAGGELVVDEVPGLDLFPDGIHVYRTREELARIVRDGKPRDAEAKQATARWVAEHHSFAARARTFVADALAFEAKLIARPAVEAAQPAEPDAAEAVLPA